MAYTALYRKFRPQTFESVIGQEHIVRTLKNQMKTGRVSHAYLFCGTRGHRENLYGEDFCQSHQLHEPHGGRRAPATSVPFCKDILQGEA